MTRRDPIVGSEAVVEWQRAGAPIALVDARSGPTARAAYTEAHLRGARWVDLDRELADATAAGAPVRGGRHPLPTPLAFARTAARLGIAAGVKVVAYDDQGGANAAARLVWMLRASGHDEAFVLDGGFALARDALGVAAGEEADAFDASSLHAWPRFEGTCDIEHVERARTDPRALVIDVRAAFRYRGESEPIDPLAGHIPGAVNVPLTENLDDAGRFLAPEQLRAKYRALLGDRAIEDVVVHCGSGVTACHTLLALERAGLGEVGAPRGPKLYVGSFSEWCRSGRPLAP